MKEPIQQYYDAIDKGHTNHWEPVDPTVYFCKAALEEKFPEKEFSMEQVKKLLKEEYDYG